MTRVREDCMRDWDEQYAGISECLADFARAHNLRIDKYLHNAITWDFVFRHPQAGQAKVQVMPADADSVVIVGSWWVDDFDTCRRSLKFSEPVSVPRKCGPVVQQLEILLKQIVAWALSDLTILGDSFPHWTADVRRNAEESIARLPLPRT